MKKTKIMGILNTTPDSFFDGGKYFDNLENAYFRAKEMIELGADIIDIGGESSRPGAVSVSFDEEIKRTIPLIKKINKNYPTFPISIDTVKPKIAKLAIDNGATMINDIFGFRDEEMIKIAQNSNVQICVMHMRGNPQNMQKNTKYADDILEFLLTWFKNKIKMLTKAGISKDRIIIDPGIGFGKSVMDNIKILKNIKIFQKFGLEILVGISRKSFLSKILNKESKYLLPATLAVNNFLTFNNVNYLRVHDVKEHIDSKKILSFF